MNPEEVAAHLFEAIEESTIDFCGVVLDGNEIYLRLGEDEEYLIQVSEV